MPTGGIRARTSGIMVPAFVAPTVISQIWDSANTGSHIALSGGNLTATAITGLSALEISRGLYAKTSGKVYWELLWSNIVGSNADLAIVVMDQTANAGTMGTINSIFWEGDSPVFFNSAGVATIDTLASGDIASVALDIGAKKVWFRKNSGSWIGTAIGDPAAGTNGIDITGIGTDLYPGIWVRNGTTIGTVVTARFASADFTLTPPAGYGTWT